MDGGSLRQRMLRFLEWMHGEWYLSAPATTFAAMCFSDKAPRGALKHLRDPDRQRALNGLRNAAWDLAYITWWGELLKRQDDEKTLWILSSLDKALRAVAQRILVNKDEVTDEDVMNYLCELLGPNNGKAVYEYYAALVARSDDPNRAINRTSGSDRVEHHHRTEAMLEEQVLQSR